MREDLPGISFYKMLETKDNLALDLKLNTFERQCLEVNEIFMAQKMFLRVNKIRKKKRYLIHGDL